jgi:F-type H+-transporting ATPase subunit a
MEKRFKAMRLTPDEIVYWEWGPVHLNATIVYTWAVMVILVIGSWLVTRRLKRGPEISRWQNMLEVIVENIRKQIRDVSRQAPEPYLPFVGTLFLFILVPNILSVAPGFEPPTASLSTTTALAASVFVAVPLYGITKQGFIGYLKNYTQPTWFMLPFNVIGEISRTIALAVRLYGNVMSATLIVGILLTLVPLFFPILMNLLGLITGVIQAYIFAVLAMVYIATATRVSGQGEGNERQPGKDNDQAKENE